MSIEQGWEDADQSQDQGAPTWFPEAIPVKITETLTENVAPEATSWLTFPIALAPNAAGTGTQQPTQLCPHRYHRYKAKFICNIPGGVTVYLSRVIDYLMSGALANQFTLTTGQTLPDYDGQQAVYAVYVAIAIAQPAVPASGVAAQNVNSFPVQVVVAGGAATVTTVNGVVVGAGDGTFVVPAYGSISVTYTVAPTMTWSGIGGVPTISVMDEGFKEVQ